jgi:hypothetical protein
MRRRAPPIARCGRRTGSLALAGWVDHASQESQSPTSTKNLRSPELLRVMYDRAEDPFAKPPKPASNAISQGPWAVQRQRAIGVSPTAIFTSDYYRDRPPVAVRGNANAICRIAGRSSIRDPGLHTATGMFRPGANAPQVQQRTAKLIPNQLRFSATADATPVGRLSARRPRPGSARAGVDCSS